MRWSLWGGLAAAVVLSACLPASAGWREFWTQFELHRRRVNAWPEPFVIPDREAVREPFRLMADNGWKLQNTFDDDLFSQETNELNLAGKMKLRWVMHEVPPHRRQIFVREAMNAEQTAARVASVHKYLTEAFPGQTPAGVMTTRIPAAGGDGSYLYGVDSSYKAAIPVPRMPAAAPSNGSGSNTESQGTP